MAATKKTATKKTTRRGVTNRQTSTESFSELETPRTKAAQKAYFIRFIPTGVVNAVTPEMYVARVRRADYEKATQEEYSEQWGDGSPEKAKKLAKEWVREHKDEVRLALEAFSVQ